MEITDWMFAGPNERHHLPENPTNNCVPMEPHGFVPRIIGCPFLFALKQSKRGGFLKGTPTFW